MTETLADGDRRTMDPRLRQDPDQAVDALRRRMHNPVCGILTSMDFLSRGRDSLRLLVGSGDLTGVHLWNGQPAPEPGSFHLGGSGLMPFESRIRILAEALERYAGHAATADGSFPIRRATWRELADEGLCALQPEDFDLFAKDQFDTDGFPYAPFDPDAPMGWVRLQSLNGLPESAVPAQWFLLGYVPPLEEPWLTSAVTTGTAAHTEPGRALLSALEELVQLDSALGHWHGTGRSVRIRHDRRTDPLRRILEHNATAFQVEPEFHLLPNSDLPGFTIACLLRQPPGVLPRVAVGLGSGSRLVDAMYRSLLEGVGVQWLASWLLVKERAARASTLDGAPEPFLWNLEGNVGLAASEQGSEAVERRFSHHEEGAALDLPPDHGGDPRAVVRDLLAAFASSGKRLYWGDLTTSDVRSLGLSVQRVWSPDTLSLCLPGAPARRHQRFAAYGGFTHDAPHPYP